MSSRAIARSDSLVRALSRSHDSLPSFDRAGTTDSFPMYFWTLWKSSTGTLSLALLW